MKVWFLTETRRLGQEKKAVESLGAAEDWFAFERWEFQSGALTALGVITVHGEAYPVRLTYPDQFPEVPPWVQPQDPARWSTHQYGQSELCLELRPDNWVPAATGADMLRSAYHLLSYERPTASQEDPRQAASAHHVTALQAYGAGIIAVFIGGGCRERLKSGTAHELNALQQMPQDTVVPIFLHDSQDRQAPRRAPPADAYSMGAELPVAIINRVAPEVVDRGSIATGSELDAAARDLIAGTSAALALFTNGEALSAYHLFENGGSHRCEVIVLPDQQELRSGRTASAANKRVAVIGAGSVGSKIADSLVRSGVRKLMLVDGDVLLPGNLERHVLDWRGVGFRKVTALKRHLLQVMPGAEITVYPENLNWQRAARRHSLLMEIVGACDVIVDATGDAATALFLGALGASNGHAFVSAAVFEGGIGALIASCIPGRDPPYAQARANYQAWCEQQNEKPPKSGARPYEALDDNDTPLVADDAAVTLTAAHAARVVLDILDGAAPGPESAWLLVGYRKAWVFEGHGHTLRMSVGTPLERQSDADDIEATEWVLALYGEHKRANSTGQ